MKQIKIGEEFTKEDTTIRFVMDDSIAVYRAEELICDEWKATHLTDREIKNIIGCGKYAVEGKLSSINDPANATIYLNNRFLCTIPTCADDMVLYDEYDENEALEMVTDAVNEATGSREWVLDIENDLSALIGHIDAIISLCER